MPSRRHESAVWGARGTAKAQLAGSGHVPSYRPARQALRFSSVNWLQAMTADNDFSWWARPSRVAYSPRMPNRRVSSVFHGMLMVLSGSEESSEEGSRGIWCCLRRRGNLSGCERGESWSTKGKDAETKCSNL